jgi:hypothetical protein
MPCANTSADLDTHLHAAAKTMHTILPRAGEAVPVSADRGLRHARAHRRSASRSGARARRRETKNDFFYFWRNVGRSNKGEVDRGRWGLGKAVFTVASRIRTVFGITRRFDDDRSLLLGQSVLKTHVTRRTAHLSLRLLRAVRKRNGLPLPIEDPILLDRFVDDFGVDPHEPGLSIVVPYYRDDELSLERISASVVEQYFYPILRGDLVVEVDGRRTHSASHRRHDREPHRRAMTHASRLCAMTRWSLAQNRRRPHRPADRGAGRAEMGRGPARRRNVGRAARAFRIRRAARVSRSDSRQAQARAKRPARGSTSISSTTKRCASRSITSFAA